MTSVREIDVSEKAAMALRDQCPAAHLVVGGDGRIRNINQTLARMLGYEKDEVKGRHVLEFVEPKDTGRVLEELHRSPIMGYAPALEIAVRAKNGTNRQLLLARSLPLPQRPGEKGIKVLLTGIDITDTKTANEILHQQELQVLREQHLQSAGRLAQGMAKHFDELLAKITNAATQLDACSPGSSANTRAAKCVREATTQAVRLTKRLRDFGQDHPPKLKTTDGGKLIASVVKSLKPRLGARVIIKTHVLSNLPMLPADVDRLRDALIELGLNANEAMPAGGRITLDVETTNINQATGDVDDLHLPAGKYLRISLTDTGTGMDNQTLASAFEPFFTTKDPSRWAGLGLSKVYGCVATHHGAVRVKSHLGSGTRVMILLPLAQLP